MPSSVLHVAASSLVLLSLLGQSPVSVSATKHVFHTKRDGRFLIAPIGAPFGFLQGGTCKITVFNYHLKESVSQTAKKKKSGLFHKNTDDGEDGNLFEGGFVLKRFDTESDFAKFEDAILEEPTTCIYNKFRGSRRRLDAEDDADDNYGYDDASIWGNADDIYKDFDDEQAAGYDTSGYTYKGISGDSAGAGSAYPMGASSAIAADVAADGVYLSMKSLQNWDVSRKDASGRDNTSGPSITHEFKLAEEGLYFLVYQVCAVGNPRLFAEVRSTFSVDLEFTNYDSFGKVSYLTAGEMPLPRLFFFFSLSYALILYIWTRVMKGESMIKSEREQNQGKKMNVNVRAIHHLMTAMLGLKTVTVFFEGVRYHFIRVSGIANLWTFVYYTLSCLRGIMLFTIILLLGSGWSLVRPFLQEREKKIILFILVLQVLDNIALVFVLNDEQGERQYEDWKAILNFIDIVCCCTVLFPIVWQVSSLESEAESEKNTRALGKLKLFRTFYLLVVSYIYFTRVVVYLVATVLGFRHSWISEFLTELGTIAFYITVGYKFRPIDETADLENMSTANDTEVEFLVEDLGEVTMEMTTTKEN